MLLNVTHGGVSTTFTVEEAENLSDEDVRRVAVELVRVLGHEVAENTFAHYVIDRHMADEVGGTIYLRPKVPFGATGSHINRAAESANDH